MNKRIILIIVCVISLIANLVFYVNLKDKTNYIANTENEQKQEDLNKLYSVYEQIVLCWDFSEMSEDEIVIALAKDAALCEAARGLYGGTEFDDNEATFGYALKYTQDYIDYLLTNRELIKTESASENLEKLSHGLDYTVGKREKKYLQQYCETAKAICIANGIEE